jgi:hypothetical protein
VPNNNNNNKSLYLICPQNKVIVLCFANTNLAEESYFPPGKTARPMALYGTHTQTWLEGRAIAQAVSRWLPTTAARGSSPGLILWDLWWTKWRWSTFSPSTSVSPANLHSNCSTIILIYHLGLYNRPEVAAVPRDLVPPHQE